MLSDHSLQRHGHVVNVCGIGCGGRFAKRPYMARLLIDKGLASSALTVRVVAAPSSAFECRNRVERENYERDDRAPYDRRNGGWRHVGQLAEDVLYGGN